MTILAMPCVIYPSEILLNGVPVLNNPIAYLARLVQKYQSNELDFSALQTFVRPQLIQRDLQDLIHTHNNDYGQYKAYGEAVGSHDLQSDDPDNVAEFKHLRTNM